MSILLYVTRKTLLSSMRQTPLNMSVLLKVGAASRIAGALSDCVGSGFYNITFTSLTGPLFTYSPVCNAMMVKLSFISSRGRRSIATQAFPKGSLGTDILLISVKVDPVVWTTKLIIVNQSVKYFVANVAVQTEDADTSSLLLTKTCTTCLSSILWILDGKFSFETSYLIRLGFLFHIYCFRVKPCEFLPSRASNSSLLSPKIIQVGSIFGHGRTCKSAAIRCIGIWNETRQGSFLAYITKS